MRQTRIVHKKKFALIGYRPVEVERQIDAMRKQLQTTELILSQEAEAFQNLLAQKQHLKDQLNRQLNDILLEEKRLNGQLI